jgi:hypothetical protein
MGGAPSAFNLDGGASTVQTRAVEVPSGYSYAATAGWFLAGGAVTAVFSGSLARLTSKADLAEVLAVGMIVPCFTWVVQLAASAAAMNSDRRRIYWDDLGRICLLGSVALLPAALANLALAEPPRWASVVNVLLSVVLMAVDLFRRSWRHGTHPAWPASWCLTITVNMLLFLWSSWSWW